MSKRCSRCGGSGELICSNCGGHGFSRVCDDQIDDCQMCEGLGTNDCPACNGMGANAFRSSELASAL